MIDGPRRVALIVTGGTIDSVGVDRLDLAWYIEAGKRLGPGEMLRALTSAQRSPPTNGESATYSGIAIASPMITAASMLPARAKPIRSITGLRPKQTAQASARAFPSISAQ